MFLAVDIDESAAEVYPPSCQALFICPRVLSDLPSTDPDDICSGKICFRQFLPPGALHCCPSPNFARISFDVSRFIPEKIAPVDREICLATDQRLGDVHCPAVHHRDDGAQWQTTAIEERFVPDTAGKPAAWTTPAASVAGGGICLQSRVHVAVRTHHRVG